MFNFTVNNGRARLISLDMVIVGDCNIRDKDYNNSIEQLSQSIKYHGVLQPILVKKLANDMFEIISGHRRFWAAKMAGFRKISAIIINEENDKKLLIYFLSENLYHKKLDFFEEADAIFKLIDEYSFTQEMIAESLGVSHLFVANRMQILNLDIDVRAEIRKNNLSFEQALLISKINNKKNQLKVIDNIVDNNLNINQLQMMIEKINNKMNVFAKPESRRKTVYIVKDVRLFDNTISEAIDVMNKSGIKASSVRNECDDFIEYIVKIPKDRIFIKKSVGF